MKAVTRYGLISPGASFTTRLTLSAAAFSISVTSSSVQPATSIAFTSMCDASQGSSSLRNPLITLTTPAGRSLVASTSANVSAGSGLTSGARTTSALPPHSAGATRLTSPTSAGSSGATVPTTPVGSGIVKLKYGPDTGLVPPMTCASLSVQPAYQTNASTASSTSLCAPRPEPSSSMNCARRPSRSEEHTSELQSRSDLVCRLLLEKKKTTVYKDVLCIKTNT